MLSAFYLALQGCSSAGQAAGPGGMPPAAVSTIRLAPQDVTVMQEFAAQTFARDMVEVRARVDGYLEKRPFEAGDDVKEGQVLYVMDLRPYQAAVTKARADLAQSRANAEFAVRQVSLLQAKANLLQAKANLLKATQDVERLRPLVAQDAASRQDLDNAAAALEANQANVKALEAGVEQTELTNKAQIETTAAQVKANEANLKTAELNLEYATIRSPIAGRIGDSTVQVGGLVRATAQTPLTTIAPLDVIWVRFQLSEAEYFEYDKRRAESPTKSVPLTLVLANGAVHPYPGRIQNVNNQVDTRTGTLELQATFPNPGRALLPGQFGRIRMPVEHRSHAILIPQIAVTDRQGISTVLTLSAEKKVQLRNIVTGARVGSDFLVTQGLKAGDELIVEGIQKARPGAVVAPSPYQADASPAAQPAPAKPNPGGAAKAGAE
ncbi:MAG: efflux RND transporter periplasmic adaptor subunit [Bryobacterales bacterium]|nr:efflux RND transporter periplasmic adaptor subunit [Bryobacterales bacterium]